VCGERDREGERERERERERGLLPTDRIPVPGEGGEGLAAPVEGSCSYAYRLRKSLLLLLCPSTPLNAGGCMNCGMTIVCVAVGGDIGLLPPANEWSRSCKLLTALLKFFAPNGGKGPEKVSGKGLWLLSEQSPPSSIFFIGDSVQGIEEEEGSSPSSIHR
jgi:hypothetical protein